MRQSSVWFLMILLVICTACTKTAVAPKAVATYYEDGAQALAQGDRNALHGCRKMALESYLKAVELFTLSDDQKALATAFNNIGTLYLRDQKPEEATHYLQEARLLHRLTQDSRGEIRALTNLAATQILMEKYGEAEAFLDEADSLVEIRQIAWPATQLTRASLHLKMGEPEKALEIGKALEERLANPSDAIASSSCYTVGRAYLAMEAYQKALDCFKKSLAIDTRRGAFRLMADDMKEAALCLKGLNRQEEAAWYFRRALKLTALMGGEADLEELKGALEALSQMSINKASPVTDYLLLRWAKGETFAAPCD